MREADVLSAVRELWYSYGVDATVPGGLHEGRVPEDVASPYASVKVVEGEIERNSDSWYLQFFTLEIMAWNRPGAGAVDAGKIQRAIRQAVNESRPDELMVNDCRTIHLRYLPGTLTEDEVLKEAQDVYIAGMSWEILLQVNRR